MHLSFFDYREFGVVQDLGVRPVVLKLFTSLSVHTAHRLNAPWTSIYVVARTAMWHIHLLGQIENEHLRKVVNCCLFLLLDVPDLFGFCICHLFTAKCLGEGICQQSLDLATEPAAPARALLIPFEASRNKYNMYTLVIAKLGGRHRDHISSFSFLFFSSNASFLRSVLWFFATLVNREKPIAPLLELHVQPPKRWSGQFLDGVVEILYFFLPLSRRLQLVQQILLRGASSCRASCLSASWRSSWTSYYINNSNCKFLPHSSFESTLSSAWALAACKASSCVSGKWNFLHADMGVGPVGMLRRYPKDPENHRESTM